MTTIHQYRVYCVTDSTYETIWAEEEPTTCPINTAHTIDSTQITIIDTRESDEVVIREETTPTGGNFACETLTINAVKNTITTINKFWPFPISILALEFVTDTEHIGDCISTSISKNTITGAITLPLDPAATWVSQNYTAGSAVIYDSKLYTCITDTVSNEDPSDVSYWRRGIRVSVSQTVIDNTAIGYYITIDDLTNSDELGRVISVDETNNYIYMESNPSNSYSPVTPSYVKQTVYTIKNFEFGPAWKQIIGEAKIGGSYVPADYVLTVDYENKSLLNDKTFIGKVEYLY